MMKKLALLIVTAVFVSGLSAQTFTPVKTMREMPKSNAIGLMPNTPPVKKAYESVGWIYSFSYLSNLIPTNYDLQSKRSGVEIFPDSCMNIVYRWPDSLKEISFYQHAFGCSFDPYSESYDKQYMTGIFPTPSDPAVVTYPYIIDTVNLISTYRWGEKEGGFNALSPDTLRIYFTYYKVYEQINNGKEWHSLHYRSDTHGDTAMFSPIVSVNMDDVKKAKGNTTRPIAANTYTLDYVLQAGDTNRYFDSIVEREGGKFDTVEFYNYSVLKIPVKDGKGFEVPAGAIVSFIVKFIPGYEYNESDTMMYCNVKPDNTLDGSMHYYHNTFGLLTLREDDKHAKAFCDPFGYNATFFEHKGTRYQIWNLGDATANKLYNSFYYPTHQNVLYTQFHFAYDSIAGIEVTDSIEWRRNHVDVKEANSIIASVYPNPASDYVIVNLKNNDQAAIRIVNVMGQVMKTIYTNEERNRISTKDLSAGIYFLSVEQDGKRYSTKLTIR